VAAQRQREEQYRKIPEAPRLKEYMEAMAGDSHVAGQPSSKKVADWALAQFTSFGLDARIEEFEAMMMWPLETSVELVAPVKYTLKIKEPVLPEDPDSGDQTPLYNAYSADGDVTGEVVYVNYGMPADFDKLKELGINVKGKIVIARYGARSAPSSWRYGTAKSGACSDPPSGRRSTTPSCSRRRRSTSTPTVPEKAGSAPAARTGCSSSSAR